MIKLVLLTDLVLDAGTQIRTEINKDHVEDLAEAYREKRELPPIDTFFDDGKYIVADGFHRVMGATQAEQTRIKTEVHAGKHDKALLFALRANASHGLRRTNSDKRNAVNIALKQWPKKSNREISEICGVSHTFVDNIRPSEAGKDEHVATVASGSTSVNRPKRAKSGGTPAPPPSTPADGEPAEPPEEVEVEPDSEFDDMGYPIPKDLVELFNRKKETEELVKKLQDVKNVFKNVQNSGGDPLYAHLTISTLLPDIELAITSIKAAIPYAVCPYCQGINLEQCTSCRHTGLIGRWMFERQIPTELQAMRKLQIKKIEEKSK